MGRKYKNNPYRKRTSRRSAHYSSKGSRKKNKTYKKNYNSNKQETKFLPCNSTNIQIIQEYFLSISEGLYNKLATSGKYQLFQFEGDSYEIYLVPQKYSRMIRKMSKNLPILHAGVHLGFMRRKRTHTGFERAFYLSYEGGEFLYQLIHTHYTSLNSQIQTIELNKIGEKSFLYGHNIDFDTVQSDTTQLEKKKIIFVLDSQKEYLGLALLLVKQAGAVHSEAPDSKFQDEYSNSPNFTVALINLTDAGYYLRKGK